MDISVDATEMLAVAEDFGRRGARAGIEVYKVTAVAARKTRDEARANASGMTALPGLPSSITYDIRVDGSSIIAEVGPELGGQGSLGHLIENGTATSAPHPFMGPAFDREVPNWIDHLSRVG